jgi:ATP-binding cassette subfamily F protein 3
MITISQLTYLIAGRTIFDDASATLMDGWKTGIVGANGAGKSTLFNLITKQLQADSGTIERSTKSRIGFVKQDMPDDDTTLLDIVLAADEERTELLKQSETETDPYKIGEIFTRLNDIDAYAAPAKASAILAGLGFKDEQLSDPISSFSGGWRMRVALASVLFQEPEILMLDEPTNHLDLEAIIWLENYLMNYPNMLMLISHDRDLLNKCVDHILHVDKKQLTLYTGNYDTFERERAERMHHQQKLHEKQQAQRAHMQSFVDRFKAKASKAKQAQSRMRALEKMDIVDAVIAEQARAFIFPQPDKMSPPVFSMDRIDIGYEENLPILTGVDERIDMDDRIALLGANGNGKSTLIKLIAGKLIEMKGEVYKAPKLRIGYFSQHQAEEMDMTSTPFYVMANMMKGEPEHKIRGKLGKFGFGKEISDNKISDLSGGEKSRLLFALMSHDAPHLLLLDEPTNHLDIGAREALVRALNEYEGAVVIVSHDSSMVERVADQLWLVKDGKVKHYDGDLNAYRQLVIENRRVSAKADKAEKVAEKEATGKKKGISKKEKRKLEAKKRKEFADIYKDIKDAEKLVSKYETEKNELENLMAQSEIYADSGKMKLVQEDYAKLLEQLSGAENAWTNAQEVYDSKELSE